ncbi:hypothetical protein MTO96_018931 [Rhipicephalus appendiculatus]
MAICVCRCGRFIGAPSAAGQSVGGLRSAPPTGLSMRYWPRDAAAGTHPRPGILDAGPRYTPGAGPPRAAPTAEVRGGATAARRDCVRGCGRLARNVVGALAEFLNVKDTSSVWSQSSLVVLVDFDNEGDARSRSTVLFRERDIVFAYFTSYVWQFIAFSVQMGNEKVAFVAALGAAATPESACMLSADGGPQSADTASDLPDTMAPLAME